MVDRIERESGCQKEVHPREAVEQVVAVAATGEVTGERQARAR